MDAHFIALLDRAGLKKPEDLAAALDIPLEVARMHTGEHHVRPPRMMVLAVERLVDVQLAEEIASLLPGRNHLAG